MADRQFRKVPTVELTETDANNRQMSTTVVKADNSKWMKIIIWLNATLTVVLLITTCILIAFVVKFSNENSDNDESKIPYPLNNTNMSDIPLDSILGLDDYLKAHCVLHRDTHEAEPMDPNGEGVTVIRNPIDIPQPINVDYSPLVNETTGEIIYYKNRDTNGNLVAKPLCQTDFETSTYTMKGNSYAFDEEGGCEFPLPDWMNETHIFNLPRRYHAITHRVTITTVEVVAELEPGHTFEFMTYNATVPGPPLRVRVGDWIDLTLINPNTSSHEHSIDFHAMSGPGGGAVSLRVLPGQQARTIWQAIYPGMFIYHCASGWVSDHISKGMYGAIIVESAKGFPYSDMDVFLGQGELYLNYPLINNKGTKFAIPPQNLHNTFDPIKERYEMSDVVMLNGAPFALVHNPIITLVGSVVRCFIVAGGPNLISSFHMIGDHFDRVWLHADFIQSPQQNIQTTTVPPGGCSVADWRHDSPGTYIFVDHALTRTFVRGNLGFIRACHKNDLACITWSSGASVGNKYPCNPNRYDSNVDVLLGNNDCVFCPWNRREFKLAAINEETDEIYGYLDQACSNASPNAFNSSNILWQGKESRNNDTVSSTLNDWRKNRYPGYLQWSLSERLRVADPMIGNKRNTTYERDGDYGSFDNSPCIIQVDSIIIWYSINRNGEGEISISTLRSNFIKGGWISFGRGGDGISAMTDSHVITVLFNNIGIDNDDGSNIVFQQQYNREYGIPELDTSKSKFPISNPSLIIGDDDVKFDFNILTGDWIKSSSGSSTVPMVVAVGPIGDRLETNQMIKHFNKAIVHFEFDDNQCLFGGSKVEMG